MSIHQTNFVPYLTRRDALRRMGGGFGMVGLASLLGDSLLQGATNSTDNPLAVKHPHFAPRAKSVIFLFLNGGLSQVDTFDPKPALEKWDGKPMPGGNPKTENMTGSLMRSPFEFKKYGQSGIEVSDIFPHVGEVIDEFCVVRSMHTDIPNHEPALMMMNTGSVQPGRPSVGSWLTYGLGAENQNLPGFVVLSPGMPVAGKVLWNSGFLPAIFQGTNIQNKETEAGKLIPFLKNEEIGLPEQRLQLDLLGYLNRIHAERRRNPQLEATIQSMEVAYRMQTEAPDVFNLSDETEATRSQYGDGDFARGCLMARRMVERGVRMVQIYFGKGQPWDNHQDILNHRRNALQSDRPIAALIRDLKARGLLDETLVIVGSEFGRTPAIERAPGVKVHNGRDHNSYGFTVLLAGGGVKGGTTYGETDEFGFYATVDPVHVHDLHATILHLLGIDHTRLTYHYSGRDFRLTDVAGNVIHPIIA